MDLLKALCLTPGVSGRESRVRELIVQTATPLCDSIKTDPMGSLICLRKPRPAPRGKHTASPAAPTKIMLAAHMDQIGFMVKHIDDKGFIRVHSLGGFDPRNLFARLVTVCTENDGDIPGVLNPGGKPIHVASEEDRKKVPEIQDLVIDLGIPAAQVKKKVKIGDPVVLQAPFQQIGKTVVSQCLDNRLACWIVLRALQQLKHHDCEIHAVFTVQEEVGLRGATTAAYEVKPDIGIGIDGTLAVDTPGVPEDQRVSILGGGAAISIMDASVIADAGIIAQFEQLAVKHKIPHQRSILPRGGTDTAALQRAATGCRAFTLSCPIRYVHTVTEMIHQDDLFACRDLLAAFLTETA